MNENSKSRPPAARRPLRVAIIGCGKIADGHVDEIHKMRSRRRWWRSAIGKP